MPKQGSEYEKFVARLQKAIFCSEGYSGQKNIKIELNKKIKDRAGIEREFDVYWEFELGSLKYKTIIECKDYNRKIEIGKIDAVIGKLHDLPDIRGIFATRKGYQTGAQEKARANNIDLLIVREQNEDDWVDENGNPLIKTVIINGTMYIPAQIADFVPTYDGKWINENTDIDITKPVQMKGFNNEIFINDLTNKEKYSLYDLSYKLLELENNTPGEYRRTITFENAFLESRDMKLKIASYTVDYSIIKPLESKIEIDYSKELLGVIEYIESGVKRMVFRERANTGAL